MNRGVFTGATPVRTLIERSIRYDLICVGSCRTGAFRDLRPSVVSEPVARRAHCSVLISRGPGA
ncbi:universal stress protein [Streptomonospora salina]|uniref:universal stress protein n=1 Tax=Streptomonospora salina TaxID=104205 RepID=UPI00338C9772